MRREPGAGASQESKRCPQESPSWVCQVGSTPEEWTSATPSSHLPETPRPAHKQAHCALGAGWGKPASPHATPGPPELAPVPAVCSCRGRNCPSPLLVLGLPPEATGPINSQVHTKWDHKAPMFFTLVELCSGLRLSFITEMKKMGMFVQPATQAAPLLSVGICFLTSFSALAFQVQHKMKENAPCPHGCRLSGTPRLR